MTQPWASQIASIGPGAMAGPDARAGYGGGGPTLGRTAVSSMEVPFGENVPAHVSGEPLESRFVERLCAFIVRGASAQPDGAT